jgi:quinol monooxygenase YgiN
MELYIFARFHAREGCESAVEQALHAVLEPSREEPGCLSIHAFRSIRDDRLFHIHSRWVNEAAFENHATLPHTVQFIERMEKLTDEPLEVARTKLIS